VVANAKYVPGSVSLTLYAAALHSIRSLEAEQLTGHAKLGSSPVPASAADAAGHPQPPPAAGSPAVQLAHPVAAAVAAGWSCLQLHYELLSVLLLMVVQ
jgi:hypothetical protein